MKRSIDKAEYETLAAFRYLLRQFLHFSEDAAGSVGLTPQQHQAMLSIVGFPGRDYATIAELAERLQIRHNSAVGLVDRLESQSLLVRTAGPDRRAVYLRLTQRGTDLLGQLSAAHRDELRRIGPMINELLGRLAEQSGEPDADAGKA